MLEKSIVSVLFFAALVSGDWRSFAKMKAGTAACYGLFILFSLYLAFIFISGRELYNLTDLMQNIYGSAADSWIRWLKR